MRGTNRTWIAAGVVAVLLIVVGAAFAYGRNDHKDAAWLQRSVCILAKREHARYVVVRAAVERGELGPEAKVVKSVHPKARAVIFEPDGDLRRWESMSEPGRNEFIDWATSGVVYAKTGAAQETAVDQIDREDCE
jgi:hypothetical protein